MRALVIGGCKGLGLSFTLELLSRGYEVTATYFTSEEEAKRLEHNYPSLKCVKCDVKDQESVFDLFNNSGYVDLNSEPLDIVVNSVEITREKNCLLKSLDEFMEVVRVNLGGTYIIDHFAIKALARGGSIINISSNNTFGYHNPSNMDYETSKTGVNILTKEFALVLKNFDLDQKIVAITTGCINKENDIKYIPSELKKNCKNELLDGEKLVKRIIDELPTYQSGDIIEIKEI